MKFSERLKTMFTNWLAPWVNLEATLLLFATLIFHRHYFGAAHPATDLLSQYPSIMKVVYIYGAIVLLASLVRIPADWQNLAAFMTAIGSAFIPMAYNALFWMRPAMPSWPELLAQLYYVAQTAISLAQIVLLITQEPGTRFAVTPRLGNVPGPLKTLAILAYIVGLTRLLERGFAVAPADFTAWVNVSGALLLALGARLAAWRQAKNTEVA